jgi:predicted dithiol-disulfide oxidoreductase (DUF899 family)
MKSKENDESEVANGAKKAKPVIVSPEDYLIKREELLQKEKELTRLR